MSAVFNSVEKNTGLQENLRDFARHYRGKRNSVATGDYSSPLFLSGEHATRVT
jgi:hypothetical protein